MTAAKRTDGKKSGGPGYVTEEWLDTVRRAMEDRGMSQGMLARRIGISQPTVSALLRGHAKRSEHAGAISELLSIPRPEVATGDVLVDRAILAVKRLVKLNPELLAEELKRLDAMATALEFASKKGNPHDG